MAINTHKARKWLLVASLAMNLAVVGIVAGAYFKGDPDGRRASVDLTAGPILRAMDADDRSALRDTLMENGVFRRSDRVGIRADREALVEVMKAEVFDEDAFRQTVVRQRARLQAAQDAVIDAIVVQISAMSPQDRAAFAARLEDQLSRRSHRD